MTNSAACDYSDMTVRYGPCDANGFRTRSFSWIQPQICNPNTGVALNVSDTQPCRWFSSSLFSLEGTRKLKERAIANTTPFAAPCEAGSVRDPASHQCVFCPEGTARQSDEDECHPCPAGNEGVATITFEEFYEFNNGLSAYCIQPCASRQVENPLQTPNIKQTNNKRSDPILVSTPI